MNKGVGSVRYAGPLTSLWLTLAMVTCAPAAGDRQRRAFGVIAASRAEQSGPLGRFAGRTSTAASEVVATEGGAGPSVEGKIASTEGEATPAEGKGDRRVDAVAGATPQATWTAPGTRPLSDAQAAALVKHARETRPENAQANDYVPTAAQRRAFRGALNRYGETSVQWNPLYRYVDGHDKLSDPSTDDLIQWGAHKWGIPEDWLKAEYVQESHWRQSQLGDRSKVSPALFAQYPLQAQIPGTGEVYESMGMAQVKWVPDGSVGAGTEPLRWQSTAFNIDFQAATVRYYYDGYCGWCAGGYAAGQQWNSIGAWFNPYPWGNSGRQGYVKSVQKILSERTWEGRRF